MLPPIALCGPTLTIRKFSKTPMTIERLIEYGSLTQEIANKLEVLVKDLLLLLMKLEILQLNLLKLLKIQQYLLKIQ